MNRSMSEVTSYFHRPRPIGRSFNYRLEERHLVVDTGMKEAEVAYGDIRSARLVFEARNLTTGFRTTLTLKSGRTVTMNNLDWRNWLDVRHKNAEYAAFVTELLRRAAEANPDLVCHAGRPPLLWAFTTLVGAATMVGMVAALGWALMLGFWTYVLVAAGFMAVFGYQIYGLVFRNKPRIFEASAPPPAVLPDASS
jgi:hypothetical protein